MNKLQTILENPSVQTLGLIAAGAAATAFAPFEMARNLGKVALGTGLAAVIQPKDSSYITGLVTAALAIGLTCSKFESVPVTGAMLTSGTAAIAVLTRLAISAAQKCSRKFAGKQQNQLGQGPQQKELADNRPRVHELEGNDPQRLASPERLQITHEPSLLDGKSSIGFTEGFQRILFPSLFTDTRLRPANPQSQLLLKHQPEGSKDSPILIDESSEDAWPLKTKNVSQVRVKTEKGTTCFKRFINGIGSIFRR